jgi:hypothetical protein
MIDVSAAWIVGIAANIAMRAVGIVVVTGMVTVDIVNSAGAIVVTMTDIGTHACCSASRTDLLL